MRAGTGLVISNLLRDRCGFVESAGQKQGARQVGEPLVSLGGFLRSPRALGPTDGPHAARLSSFSARCMATGTFGLGLNPTPHGRRAWDIHLEPQVQDDQASLHTHLPDTPSMLPFVADYKGALRRGVTHFCRSSGGGYAGGSIEEATGESQHRRPGGWPEDDASDPRADRSSRDDVGGGPGDVVRGRTGRAAGAARGGGAGAGAAGAAGGGGRGRDERACPARPRPTVGVSAVWAEGPTAPGAATAGADPVWSGDDRAAVV